MVSFPDSITVISFKFPSLCPSPESRFKLIQIKRNPNELWLVEWYRGVSFHMGNLEKYEGPISQYWRRYSNILAIFSDCINIFQRHLVFSSSTGQVLAVGVVSFQVRKFGTLEL